MADGNLKDTLSTAEIGSSAYGGLAIAHADFGATKCEYAFLSALSGGCVLLSSQAIHTPPQIALSSAKGGLRAMTRWGAATTSNRQGCLRGAVAPLPILLIPPS